MAIPMEGLGPPTESESELRRRARFLTTARVLTLVTGAIGFLGVFGWIAGFPLLRQLNTSVPAINPLTALVLLWCAVAIYPSREIPRWVRVVLGFATGLVGLLRTLDFLGFSTNIDALFTHSLVHGSLQPNRMALGTAIGLLLLGAFIVERGLRLRIRKATNGLALIVILIGFSAALGHLYGAIFFSTIPLFTALAPQTALALMALGFAFLFARPHENPTGLFTQDSEGGIMVRQIPPLVLVLPAVLAWLGLLGVQLGWYDFGTSVTIIVSLNVALFEVLLWRVGGRLDALDRERTRAEAVVAQSRDQALEDRAKDKAVLSSIGDGMYVADARGRIILMNDTAIALLDAERTPLLGKPFTSIPLEDKAGQIVPRKERPATIALSEGRTVRMSMDQGFWYRRSDGSRFPIEMTVTPIRRSGRTEGAVVLFRDITHEFEMDRAKSEFVSLASHQLQTPLTAVSWYLELLHGKVKFTEEQRHLFDRATEGNRRMAELVNTLLNVSRIDLGTYAIEPRKLSLGPIITSVINELKPAIAKKKLRIRRETAETGTVTVDPILLRIVLQNFVGNAVKYTPEGGRVAVTTRVTPRGLEIVVADTGYGIPVKERTHVFEKLYRAENVRTLVPDGDGLGLYIVKSIVKQSGGTIGFTSHEGQGTTFTVRWPRSGMRPKPGNRQLS